MRGQNISSRGILYKTSAIWTSRVPTVNRTSSTPQYYSTDIPQEWIRRIPMTTRSMLNDQIEIQSTVSVIDTAPGDWNKPLVFTIHGIAGQGADFQPLISQLSQRGVRVISPSYLGFEGSLLKRWQVNHVDFSTTGRAQFTKSLLDIMGIKRIDMLLTHSAGTWLGYKLLADLDFICSAGLLCPVGVKLHKMLRPHIGVRIMSRLLRIERVQPLLIGMLEQIYKNLGFSGVNAGTHLLASQHLIALPQLENVAGHATTIRQKKIPLFLAHALNDKIVEWDIPADVINKHWELPSNICTEFDAAGDVVDSNPHAANPDDWKVRVLLFEKGGHVVYKLHSDIILQEIMSILGDLKSSNS